MRIEFRDDNETLLAIVGKLAYIDVFYFKKTTLLNEETNNLKSLSYEVLKDSFDEKDIKILVDEVFERQNKAYQLISSPYSFGDNQISMPVNEHEKTFSTLFFALSKIFEFERLYSSYVTDLVNPDFNQVLMNYIDSIQDRFKLPYMLIIKNVSENITRHSDESRILSDASLLSGFESFENSKEESLKKSPDAMYFSKRLAKRFLERNDVIETFYLHESSMNKKDLFFYIFNKKLMEIRCLLSTYSDFHIGSLDFRNLSFLGFGKLIKQRHSLGNYDFYATEKVSNVLKDNEIYKILMFFSELSLSGTLLLDDNFKITHGEGLFASYTYSKVEFKELVISLSEHANWDESQNELFEQVILKMGLSLEHLRYDEKTNSPILTI